MQTCKNHWFEYKALLLAFQPSGSVGGRPKALDEFLRYLRVERPSIKKKNPHEISDC